MTAELERVSDDTFEGFDGVVEHVTLAKDMIFDDIDVIRSEADALVEDVLGTGEADARSLQQTVGRRSS